MSTARAKYQDTAPSRFHPSEPTNPRKEFRDPTARPPGKSGGVAAITPHRVSSSVRRRVRKSARA